jgi:hypothetical protein
MMHYSVDELTTFFWEPLPDEQEEEEDEDSDEGEDANEDVEGGEDKKTVSANPDGYWGTDCICRVLRE